MPGTPTHELSSTIIEALCKANLIPPERREELLTKLSSGTITSRDWRSSFEMALPKEQPHHASQA